MQELLENVRYVRRGQARSGPHGEHMRTEMVREAARRETVRMRVLREQDRAHVLQADAVQTDVRPETVRRVLREARGAALLRAARAETVRAVRTGIREAREAVPSERADRDVQTVTREEDATATSAPADRECAATAEIPAGMI